MKLISISAAPVGPISLDLKALKQDPTAYAKSMTLPGLVALLKHCAETYTNKGKSPLTDVQYDALEAVLRLRKPNHSFLKKVGAMPTTRSKVTLPYPLFSLDKVKPGEKSFQLWAASHPGPYIISDKEDGLSIEVCFDLGVPVKAYTRGNGIKGTDVTHLIPFMGVPMHIPYKKEFVVRQELAMKEATFLKLFSKEANAEGGYENARNLVAGVVGTLKKEHAALRHISHVAYEVITPRMKPSEALARLERYGFSVVPYRVMQVLNEKILTRYLEQRKQKSPIAIDGLVIEQDKKTTRPTLGNPDYAVAFKVNSTDDHAAAEVVKVEYQPSKFGVLSPVVYVKVPGADKPGVRLKGVTISKFSGKNAKFIVEKKIGPGALITIVRSGDVIPDIVSVEKPARKAQLPGVPCSWKGVTLVMDNHQENDEVVAKQLTSFFTTLNIDFIKQGSIVKMMDAGFESTIDIIKASVDDFMEVSGVKSVTANKWYKAIHDIVDKPMQQSTLMKASGCFDLGMGERRIEMVLKVYPTIVEDYGRTRTSDKTWIDKICQDVDGFQEKTARLFIEGIPKYKQWMAVSGLKTTREKPQVKTIGTSLNGISVAFTGFRSEELKQKILQNRGSATDTITKETSILLVSSLALNTAKVQKARASGIKIMTADQFVKAYKL